MINRVIPLVALAVAVIAGCSSLGGDGRDLGVVGSTCHLEDLATAERIRAEGEACAQRLLDDAEERCRAAGSAENFLSMELLVTTLDRSGGGYLDDEPYREEVREDLQTTNAICSEVYDRPAP